MDLFWLKKAVSFFLHPIPVVLGMLVMGWVSLAWSRRRHHSMVPDGLEVLEDYSVPRKRRRPGCLGMVLIFGALLLLYLSSIGLIASHLFFSLERQHPPLDLKDEKVGKLKPDYIVILPGSYRYRTDRPITSRLSASTTARMVEGMRIHAAFPNAKIVLTGGSMKKEWPSVASEMEVFARLMGLKGEVILEEKARDTKDHARLLKPMLEDKTFILVTSCYHMPRAMGLFRGQGLDPIAGSAEVKFGSTLPFNYDQLIPGVGSMSNLNIAIHEYLGMLWAKMRGQFGNTPEKKSEEKKPDDEKEIFVRA